MQAADERRGTQGRISFDRSCRVLSPTKESAHVVENVHICNVSRQGRSSVFSAHTRSGFLDAIREQWQ